MTTKSPQTLGVCKGIFLSSDTFSRQPFFDGYLFNKADLILREEGAQSYQDTGESILIGEDGCYVVGRTTNRGFEIGTDFSGNYRLFLYRDKDYWALSNSVMTLADAAKCSNRTLTLNKAQFCAWRLHGPFCNQLTSFSTVFNEVQLVPSDRIVLVGENGLTAVARERFQPEGTYAGHLGIFLTVWLSRVKTLLNHASFHITVDLSGGLDSRLVFALFSNFAKTDKRDIFDAGKVTINTKNDPHLRVDFSAAEAVLSALGIKRRISAKGVGHEHIAATTALAHWRTNSMAQYAPFRSIATRQASFEAITFAGLGGEEYRQFYKADSIIEQTLGYKRQFLPRNAFSDWARAIEDSIERLVVCSDGEVDPLILHYREFRSRFHAGTPAMNAICALPLKSVYLREAANKTRPPHNDNRQLLFDILCSLEPTLLEVPYDEEAKRPTRANLESLTKAEISELYDGKVYASMERSVGGFNSRGTEERVAPFDIIEDMVKGDGAYNPRRVVSKRLLKKVESDIVRAKKLTGFVRQREAVDLHYVLLAFELQKLGVLNTVYDNWFQRLQGRVARELDARFSGWLKDK